MSRQPPSARDPQKVLLRLLPTLGKTVPGHLRTAAATPLPRAILSRQSTTSNAGETVRTIAASGSAQTLPDATVATIHYVTLTANCTFTLPPPVVGRSFTLILVQDGTGSRTATWPVSVEWPGGAAPTLTTTAAKRDVFSFLCADGSTWFGFVAGLYYS